MKSIDLAAIDLNLLVAFESLFEERSVTAAAQRLNLGQPAMSAALARLRSLFNDELFIRIGREMRPTTKALEIAPGIALALQQIRQTLETSQTFDPATSQRAMTIACSDYTSFILLPKLLELCRQTAPGIDFRLVNLDKNQIETWIEHGKIEVAIGTFQVPIRQTFQQPLIQEHFVGICRKGHPALSSGKISLETFVNLSHALFTLRQDATGEIDKVLAQLNLRRRIIVTTPNLLIIPMLVASSDLVAAIPFHIAEQSVNQMNVEIFELPVKTEPWIISMIWSKLSDRDPANLWLRQTIAQALTQVVQ
ncbi:MAG: LysR family transcriptional regulator [Leptolyngbyaceae cyanobacterium bins.302]|nr:LysR family transcriptional regulator [Leptolyngbyaceae cyanobacterium bins.302]